MLLHIISDEMTKLKGLSDFQKADEYEIAISKMQRSIGELN
jgi:hypothetical protein